MKGQLCGMTRVEQAFKETVFFRDRNDQVDLVFQGEIVHSFYIVLVRREMIIRVQVLKQCMNCITFTHHLGGIHKCVFVGRFFHVKHQQFCLCFLNDPLHRFNRNGFIRLVKITQQHHVFDRRKTGIMRHNNHRCMRMFGH